MLCQILSVPLFNNLIQHTQTLNYFLTFFLLRHYWKHKHLSENLYISIMHIFSFKHSYGTSVLWLSFLVVVWKLNRQELKLWVYRCHRQPLPVLISLMISNFQNKITVMHPLKQILRTRNHIFGFIALVSTWFCFFFLYLSLKKPGESMAIKKAFQH